METQKQTLSIIIPCYNSEHTIQNVVESTKKMIETLGYQPEFVLVNDSSKDHTFQKLRELAEKYPFVKALDLSRNFGQHNALMAAMNEVTGDYVVGMDDDGQTHPSQLPKLLEELQKGYDIVFGHYDHKKHSAFRNFGSWFNTFTAELLTGRPKDLKTSSFWVARRFVIDEACKYQAPYPHIQGLFFRVTRNVSSIPIEHFDREFGSSGYTLKKLIKLWSAFTNFSVLPLRAALYLGIFVAGIGFLYAIVTIIRKILHPAIAMGWASTMVVLLIMSGIILLFLGIIGEYLGRLFMASNSTPQFVVREKLNCDQSKEQTERKGA